LVVVSVEIQNTWICELVPESTLMERFRLAREFTFFSDLVQVCAHCDVVCAAIAIVVVPWLAVYISD
jgi:hypothetical protein